MVFLTDRPACWLADLRTLRLTDLRAIQPCCPQTWQTAILLADSMAIPPFTNHELKLQTCVLLNTARYVFSCSKWIELLQTWCSQKHGKICFWVTQNLSGYFRKSCTFRELLPPKLGELRVNEIFFGKYSFVFIKINTFALNSIDWL